MAGQIPTPRSYQAILADMINTYLVESKLSGFNIAGPILSLLEANAQSDFINSNDIFNLLDSQSLDRASGDALDKIVESLNSKRRGATFANGYVTFSDISFSKISTNIYSGSNAPNAGTTYLKVADASNFPATGSIYIGRNTVYYEGPVAYTAITPTGSYYTITLSTPTQNFHNVNETVILAQGGERIITAGTIVKTATNNISASTQYNVLYSATIPDGEIEVTNVQVVCNSSGTSGNVASNMINQIDSPPFTNATITNPLPFTNGLDIETDEELRERIKSLKQSYSKGTATAINSNIYGIIAPDESKTLVSSSVIDVRGEPTQVYIDDGSGYEEKDSSVAYESIIDQALGGEQYAQLTTGIPVTKAFVTSNLSEPFNIEEFSTLSVKINGITSEHIFNSSEFRAINNATAYEVIAAINADSNLDFCARTANNGTSIVLFAKADSNNDIQVSAPSSGTNANDSFDFPTENRFDLKLYKNNQLLYKDGKSAILNTLPQYQWNSSIATGATLIIAIDGTAAVTYTITDSDFANLGSGYTTVSKNNSLESWAQVLNNKIPGITASVDSESLIIVSNLSNSDRASLVISGGTLATSDNMFDPAGTVSASGQSSDYVFDRNTGQIKLTDPLAVGDTLSAGTYYTKAYAQSLNHSSGSVTMGTGNFWVIVDGAPQVISSTLNGTMTITMSSTTLDRIAYKCSDPTAWANVQKGDWMIVYDSAFTTHGAWRVTDIDTITLPDDTIIIESTLPVVDAPLSVLQNGIKFIRSDALIQQVNIVGGGVARNLTSVEADINAIIKGATASVYRNTYLRLTTNTVATSGDIMICAADTEGEKLLFTTQTLYSNEISHLASIVSTNSQFGTPEFDKSFGQISSASAVGTTITSTTLSSLPESQALSWGRRFNTVPNLLIGNNAKIFEPIKSVNTGASTITLSDSIERLQNDPFIFSNLYSIGYEDDFNFILDNDSSSKNFSVNMFRNASIESGTDYDSTVSLNDADNSDATFSSGFGSSFDFANYAVFMPARAISHYKTFATVADRAILWRYSKKGLAGENVKIEFTNPTTANASFAVSTTNGQYNKIKISLPSDTARTIPNLSNSTMYYAKNSASGAHFQTAFTYAVFDASAGALVRAANVVTATLTYPVGIGATGHGISAGDIIYIRAAVVDPNFPVGAKIVTGVGVAGPASQDITYYEVGANAASVQNYTASASGMLDPDFSSVVTGDIVTVSSGSSFNTNNETTFRIIGLTPGTANFSIYRNTNVGEQLVPLKINNTSYFSIYPILDKTAAEVVTWVNANMSDIVTAKNVDDGAGASTGTGIINKATLDEHFAGNTNYNGGTLGAQSLEYWSFYDGINFVQSTNLGVDPNTFTFKRAVNLDWKPPFTNPELDWENESLVLVPTTAKNIVDYLNSPIVTGLYASSEIATANENNNIQITTNTIGSAGAVRITGGTANSVVTPIIGSAEVVDTNYLKLTVDKDNLKGLTGGKWIALEATSTQYKPWPSTGYLNGKTLAVSLVSGKYRLTIAGGVFRTISSTTTPTVYSKIYKHGNFTVYNNQTGGGANLFNALVTEGQWCVITGGAHAPYGAISTVNAGVKQVVRKSDDRQFLFIEDNTTIEEDAGISTYQFYTYNSIMPGDKIIINTDVLGTGNRGTFTVTSVISDTVIEVDETMSVIGATSIGATDSLLINVEEANPIRLIKKIIGIGRNAINTNYWDIICNSTALSEKITETAGVNIIALDKLDFSTNIVTGIDSYSYATGLIGETAKVLYGDSSDPTTYPGVVAAGAKVNISSPLIKRIELSLQLRLKTSISTIDIIEQVRNSVAATINANPLGQSLAFSSIIDSANNIDGVVSVTVISPTYNVNNDLIEIAANEKSRVLDPENDILISLIE